ncbi:MULTISPECIES: helix-turn-helix transcriptional regulator [Actinokineospora]|uniref:HTH luxR-type domain-containing protein n=1 Tax=Actinokineospora fastidiosa TaxID=1816 RepID=A0A918LK00_9PSEU|nr:MULTISPECIES: helix-turn-helix transcriptional regulator [Actinokineospora]UVS79278.1 ATP-dependent transcriptional regulator [Actinokineospora sp. UTMC 2448]GGS60156.1 hypothetical protein GCM10010171_63860 [Actinokineospora fastidiosa]
MSVLALDPPVSRHTGVDALLATADREVLLMTSTAPAVRRVDQANLRRGVRYRVLAPDQARTATLQAPRLAALSVAGAATRTVPDVPADVVVIDRAVAILPDGVFRLPSVVTAVMGLFDRVWAAGTPLLADDLPDDGDLGPRERELLGLLCAGCTDETAAARLGVSVRTVRRMVADLMHRLGARSRFQAGVKAADRGWLSAAG